MECYIEYLDSKNNFRQTKKDFKTFDEALDWMGKNFENRSLDMIKYY